MTLSDAALQEIEQVRRKFPEPRGALIPALYLKHNLNAQAVGALKQEVGQIESEVETLIKDIGNSIQEADSFLKNFE